MKQDWGELTQAFVDIDTTEEMVEFLQGILTPGELEEIAQRLKIVKLLKKGMGQHEIAKKLGVGVATVTRGSKELQKGRFTNI